MHSSEEYRSFYEQCRRASKQTSSPHQQAMMASMAETWLLLARKAAAEEGKNPESKKAAKKS
jgi:hypothetical protein